MSFEAWLSEAAILIVDDQPEMLTVLRRMLEADGFLNVVTVQCPESAVERFHEIQPEVVLLDYHMPQVSGIALLEELSAIAGPATYLPVIILTADPSRDVKRRALVCGAADFIEKPVEAFELANRVRNLLRTRYLYLQLEREKQELEIRVAEKIVDATRAQAEILERLAIASVYRDNETAEHTRRVGELSAQIALQLGFDPEQVALLRQAAQLHDVGKIGISDQVLLAPGKLSRSQFEEMRGHTRIGKEILSGGRSELLLLAESIACCHHERWDGSGYPQGLTGDEIPLAARIVAVADFFDALTHERRYRAAVSAPQVVEMIRGAAGTHFDPGVVHAFTRCISA